MVYDKGSQVITISGPAVLPLDANGFFSNEQQMIIKALSGYEAATNVRLEGTIDFFGTTKEIKADITKIVSAETITKSAIILERDGSRYRAIITLDLNNSSTHSVYETLPDGAEELVDLYAYAGVHPYDYIDQLKLTGLNKYRNLTIEAGEETETMKNFKVALPDNETVVKLTLQGGKLIRYHEELNGIVKKDLNINY